MRERMDLSPRCPQCGGPVVNSTHYLGRTEHPLVRECENGHAWDAIDNVTMLDANGAALVTKDQTPPSIVPTDDELLTYRGRGIDGSRNSPGGYMGCGTLEEHCLQVRDPKSWVQSALPRWRESALAMMAHPSGDDTGAGAPVELPDPPATIESLASDRVEVQLSRHRTLGDCVVQIDVEVRSRRNEVCRTRAVVEVQRPASQYVISVSFDGLLAGWINADVIRELVLLFREAVVLSRNARMDTTFVYNVTQRFEWEFVKQVENA